MLSKKVVKCDGARRWGCLGEREAGVPVPGQDTRVERVLGRQNGEGQEEGNSKG